MLEIVRECPVPLVVDADGLNALTGDVGAHFTRRDRPTVLTPHPGEMARLLGSTAAEVQGRRLEAARKLDPQRWTLATPAPGDVRAIAGVLGVRYRQLEDGEFNHSTVLVLLDADGRELARTEQVGSKTDAAFLAAVRKATGT